METHDNQPQSPPVVDDSDNSTNQYSLSNHEHHSNVNNNNSYISYTERDSEVCDSINSVKSEQHNVIDVDLGDPDSTPVFSPTDPDSPEERQHLNQDEFDKEYEAGDRPHKSVRDVFSHFKDGCECSGKSIKKHVVGLFPIFQLPKYYNMPGDLISDLIAGLTVGIMHVPQGMAYASLASLPVEYGLYTSLFPVIMYALLGTSRHVSPGTYGLVSLMMGGVVQGYNCEAVVLGTSVESLSWDSDSDEFQGNFSRSFNSYSEEGTFSSSFAGSSSEFSSSSSDSSSSSSSSMSEETANEEILACKVEVAVAVTLVGGLFQLLLGVLRLGFITNFLSEPLARGFTTGAAVHVFSSQLKKLTGVPLESHYGPFKLVYIYAEFFRHMDQVNTMTVIVSALCMVTLFLVKVVVNPRIKKVTRNKGFIPIDFVLIILGTAISVLLQFEDQYEMWVVGDIPIGIPAPKAPEVSVIANVFTSGIELAFVSYASSMSVNKLFAKKHNYECDANQELIAHGVTNVICSNLNCFMMGTSLSRSAVCENVGCKSPITGMVSSGLLIFVVLFIASYFEQLPRCVLAAIIVVALRGMFMQFTDLKRYWKVNKIDFSVWLVTFIAVVMLDAAIGLIVGVVYALLTIIATTQRPYSTLEGRIEHTEIYKDVQIYSKAKKITGIKIFRFDGSIYFASKQYFMDCVYEKTECDPKRVKVQTQKWRRKSMAAGANHAFSRKHQQSKLERTTSHKPNADKAHIDMESGEIQYGPCMTPDMHHLIIDSTTIGYLDDSGVQSLKQICNEYRDIGVTVFLAGCKLGVRHMLEKGGFHNTYKKDILFPTVHDAVMAAQKEGVKKKDDVEIIMMC